MTALFFVSGLLTGIASTAILITNVGDWSTMFIPALATLIAGVVILEKHNDAN